MKKHTEKTDEILVFPTEMIRYSIADVTITSLEGIRYWCTNNR